MKITIDKGLYNEFTLTALEIEGYKRDRNRISFESAIRLYLNYAKPYKDKRLYDVAVENGMEVWEVGQYLISRFMELNSELGVGLWVISNEEHLKLVKKHLGIED